MNKLHVLILSISDTELYPFSIMQYVQIFYNNIYNFICTCSEKAKRGETAAEGHGRGEWW